MQTLAQSLNLIPFSRSSYDPKTDAQRNLSGRTHYVDDATLRYFKARVLATATLFDGAFFMIRESTSLDYQHSKRGQRVVVFNLFGETVFRPDMSECGSVHQACARFEEWRAGFDPVAHYCLALEERARRLERDANAYRNAIIDLRIAA
jgi:hypothetical protein